MEVEGDRLGGLLVFLAVQGAGMTLCRPCLPMTDASSNELEVRFSAYLLSTYMNVSSASH